VTHTQGIGSSATDPEVPRRLDSKESTCGAV
jgi:hypothetical protein